MATGERDQFDDMVGAILNGTHGYGRENIDALDIARNVVWYGSPGISASVGMWIRATWEINKEGTHMSAMYKFWAHGGVGDPRRVWYFAIAMGGVLHVVGGTNEMGGEGNRARQIAEAYLKRFVFAVSERPATNLIDYLVEGFM